MTVIEKGHFLGLRFIMGTAVVVALKAEANAKDLAAVIKPPKLRTRYRPSVAVPTRYHPAPGKPPTGKRKRQWR